MSRRVQDRQDGFLGGLNITSDPNLLASNEARLLENAHITQFGTAQKRNGSRYLNDTARFAFAAVKAGFTWERATASPQILAICDGHLWTATYGVPATFTDQGSGLSTAVNPSIVAFRNGSGECVFIADGGLLNSWDGTTFTQNIASTPSVARLWVYNQRLFGISGNNETLYWSALNNGATLGIAASGGGSAVVRTFGDQSLTMGAAGEGALFLWHVSGISLFQGWTQDDINISAGTNGLTQDLGTVAWRAVVPLEGAVLFVSERGVYRLTLSGATPVGVKVESAFTALSGADLADVTAVHHRTRQEVWFNVPGYGILPYNHRLQTWCGPFTNNVGITCLFESLDTDGTPIILAGTSDGFIKRLDYPDSYLDEELSDGTGGVVYNFIVQLHRMFCGEPWETKSLRWIHLLVGLGGSGNAHLQWATELSSGTYFFPADSDVWSSDPDDIWDGTGVWGGAGTVESLDIPAHGIGTRIDITLTDASEADASLSGARVTAFPAARR